MYAPHPDRWKPSVDLFFSFQEKERKLIILPIYRQRSFFNLHPLLTRDPCLEMGKAQARILGRECEICSLQILACGPGEGGREGRRCEEEGGLFVLWGCGARVSHKVNEVRDAFSYGSKVAIFVLITRVESVTWRWECHGLMDGQCRGRTREGERWNGGARYAFTEGRRKSRARSLTFGAKIEVESTNIPILPKRSGMPE